MENKQTENSRAPSPSLAKHGSRINCEENLRTPSNGEQHYFPLDCHVSACPQRIERKSATFTSSADCIMTGMRKLDAQTVKSFCGDCLRPTCGDQCQGPSRAIIGEKTYVTKQQYIRINIYTRNKHLCSQDSIYLQSARLDFDDCPRTPRLSIRFGETSLRRRGAPRNIDWHGTRCRTKKAW